MLTPLLSGGGNGRLYAIERLKIKVIKIKIQFILNNI